MIHNKFRYLLTLVALFAMTAGAWAEEKSETISTNTSQVEYTGEHFKITPNIQQYMLEVADLRYYDSGLVYFIVQTLDGQNISKLDLQISYIDDTSIDNLSLSSGTKSYDSNKGVLTITNVNADHVQISLTEEDEFGFVEISSVTYYYEESSTGPEVAWNATTKQATFEMPGSDVELIPEYYPGMLTLGNAIEGGTLEVVGLGLGTTSFTAPNEWFKNSTQLASSHFEGFKGVTEEEAKAWPGVPATGKVALFYNYDETEQKWDFIYFKDGVFDKNFNGEPQQLATIYNLPDFGYSVFYTTGMQTPEGFEKDEEGNIYVADKTEFKVKATPAEGYRLVSLMFGETDVTDKVDADGIATVTMPEGENDITLTATFSNEYNVALNAEGLSDEEAAAWKGATGDNDPAALPLENVKYGTEVKVSYTGTKKVIGVKAAKKKAGKTITIGDVELIYADGDTWETIVSKNSDKIKIRAGGYIAQVAQPAPNQFRYLKVVLSTNKVNPSDIIDPSKNYEWGTIGVYS